MQITQIDLDNVKSYRRASIPFTEGTNAICGPNGAGKSTLLESIGFALFDVLPYSQSQFVREGEKTATVTIHIVGGDGRAYQVVRRCGSYSQYYIYDPEIDQKLTTSKNDTVEWLYDFLGVEESSDLSVLFRDAVGVPQGLLTSAFLLTPANRKSTFDPLLRVDEYRRVWDALLEPRRHLEQQIAAEEKRIAGFEAEVKALPDWQAKATDLQAKVHTDEQLQEVKQAELKDVTRRKEQLEAVKERLDALDKSVTQAEGEAKALDAQLEGAQDAVEKAKQAQLVVDDSRAGHQTYLAAQANLETLEDQRKQRDGLSKSLQGLGTKLALAEQQVKGLKTRLGEIQVAEAKMEELQPQVEIQGQLEDSLKEAERSAERLADAKKELSQERDGLADLEAKRSKMQKELEELDKVDGELERLRAKLEELDREWESLQPEVAGYQAELDQFAGLATRMSDRVDKAAEALKQAKSRLAHLEANLSEIRSDLERLAEIEDKIDTLQGGLEGLDSQHDALTAQAAAHQAALDQVRAQTAILETAETAICPVCDGPLTPRHRAELLARNHARETELKGNLNAAQAEQGGVAEARKEKQRALRDLEKQAKRLPRPGEAKELASQVEAQRETVTGAQDSLAAEQGDVTANEEWQAEVEAALAKLKPRCEKIERGRIDTKGAIEQRERRCKELPRPAEAEELAARIQEKRERVEDLESMVDELAGAPDEVRRLEAELGAMGDPRREYQRAADVAGERQDVESELAETGEQVSEHKESIGQIEEKLAVYADLDERLKAERHLLEAQETDHQRYLGHIREAEVLAQRRDKVEMLRAELERAQAERERLVVERDEVAADFDAQTYATLADSYQALREDLAKLGERLRQQRVQLGDAQAKIEELTAVQGQLETARAEHGELTETQTLLGYIRQVLRDAGPKVTKALVEVISLQAARLYADIMADHTARLQWTEDYEILLTTGGRERTFQQLSGGEQMASALAVRLALLREVSDIDVAFFDEPTANLDDQRRDNLAEQILNVKGFSQLFVISHDDTFERDTDHVVRVIKENGVSRAGPESVERVEV
jgi:exonuclease SbcC